MDKTQKNLKLLGLITFVAMIISLIFENSFSLFVMLGLLIAAMVMAKDTEDEKAMLPVVGAELLYFVVLIIDVFFGIFVKLIGHIEGIVAIDGWTDWLNITNRLDNIFGIGVWAVTIAAIVFAVISIIALLKGKDFSTTLIGKVANFVYNRKKKEAYVCPNCGAVVKGAFCAKCGTKKVDLE